MKRILIVEDKEKRYRWFRDELALYCGAAGIDPIRLSWAKNAGQAIGMIKRDKDAYAAILLDFNLDEKNVTHEELFTGKDVAMAIVTYTSKEIPVLVHSTNASNGPVLTGMLKGSGFHAELRPFYTITREDFREWLSEEVC